MHFSFFFFIFFFCPFYLFSLVGLRLIFRESDGTNSWWRENGKGNFISIRIWRVVIRGGGYLLACNPALFHGAVDSSISSQMLKRGRKKEKKNLLNEIRSPSGGRHSDNLKWEVEPKRKKNFGSPCLFDQLMTPKLRNRKYRKGNRRFYFSFIFLFGEEEEESM